MSFAPAPGTVPVAGDWDGNGTETVGVVQTAPTGSFFLRNSTTAGLADLQGATGAPAAFAADWNGAPGDELAFLR